MRGALAGLLAVVGVVMTPLADAGLWTQRELISRDQFVTLATRVLEEDEVRVLLAKRITDEVDEEVGLSPRGREVLGPAVESGLTTAPFRSVYQRAVGDVHDQITDGADRLELRLDALFPLIQRAVTRVDPEVADDLAGEQLPTFTIITKDEVPTFFQVVKLVRRASLAFPIAWLVLLLAAVVLASNRSVMLAVIGSAVVVVSLLLCGLIFFGRDLLSNVTGPDLNVAAFGAAYDVVTGSFVIQTLGFALLGAIALVGGLATKVHVVRNTRPIGWA